MSGLQDLLVKEMEDLLHAENQLVKALPKMAKAAHEPKLRQAFETHLKETEGHVERLQQAFELLAKKPKTKVCHGMKGLVEEGQEQITEGKQKGEFLSDLAIVAAAQKVEHYEISAYGTLRTMAEKLGQSKLAALLAETLREEEKADELLTEVSAPILNKALESLETGADSRAGRMHATAGKH